MCLLLVCPYASCQLLGYDFYAEPVRKEALDHVLESYTPKATEGVVLADTGLPVNVFIVFAWVMGVMTQIHSSLLSKK